MRKLLLALAASLSLVAGFIVAAPASNAADVTFVQGLLKGRFGAYQAFDVKPTPSFPTCTDSATYAEFQVRVQGGPNGNNAANEFGQPYSLSAQRFVDISNRYLSFFETGDADYPWGIRLFQQIDDKELRWNSTTRAWVTEPAGGWTANEKVFTEKGNILGVAEKGFFHVSANVPNQNWGYGTYFSVTRPLIVDELVKYTPAAAFNSCKRLSLAAYDVAAANPTAMLDSYWVNDNPLGPPTNDVSLKNIKVNAGEIEGQVKADVFEYNWGVATAGTDSLQIALFPTNPAALIEYQGNLYRSGQPFTNISVAPGSPKVLAFKVISVDETKTQDYSIRLTAYPTNVKPQISKLSEKSASSKGGTPIKISGVGFTFAKGVVFSPDADIYSPRAVTATKVTINAKHPKLLKGEFRVINNREIEVSAPAVPNPAGGFFTGDYQVMIDTPFYNSGANADAMIAFLQPQQPVSKLQWAKSLIVPGLTKLLGLPVKMNSGNPPKFKVSVKFFGRSKPVGDAALYTVIRKKDGIYIEMKTSRRAQVTTAVSAKGTKKFAPYYASKVLTSK